MPSPPVVDLAAARARRRPWPPRFSELRDTVHLPPDAPAPCPRCGDPDGRHRVNELDFINDTDRDSVIDEIAFEARNCALYRIGTKVEQLNDIMLRFVALFAPQIGQTTKEGPDER